MKVTNTRKSEIDILKCICSFAIVIIHTPFEGAVGTILRIFSRVAVPIFFMISGYYYSFDSKRINRQIRKITYVIVFSHLLYFIFDILMDYIAHVNLYMFNKNESTIDVISQVIIFNVSPAYTHLWYVLAYLYILILFRRIDLRHISSKLLAVVSVFLLFGNLIFGKYSYLILGKSMEPYVSRNFLFTGIPFYLLGYLISKKSGNVSIINKYGARFFIPILLILSFLSVVEKSILSLIGESSTGDIYITSIMLVVTLFLYALYINDSTKKNRGKNVFAKIGNKYTLLIYIMHPIIIQLLKVVLGFESCICMKLFFSILVYVITLLLAVVVNFAWRTVIKCMSSNRTLIRKNKGDV